MKFARKQHIAQRNLSDYLQQLLAEKGLERADTVREAGLDATYGYQIFMGQGNPTHGKVLQIVFALKYTLQEANRVLQAAATTSSTGKNRRDTIIIFLPHQR